MKQFIRMGLVTLTAAVVLFAAFHRLRAQGERPGHVIRAAGAVSLHTPGDWHSHRGPHATLLATYFAEGDLYPTGVESAGQFLPLDEPTTLECPAYQGCTVEADQSVQVGGQEATGNTWGPVVYVDGIATSYAPTVGEVPSDSSFALVTSNQSILVTQGTHTVQSLAWSTLGMNLGTYSIVYRVFVQ
jgi:hypothetical protein